MTRATLRKNVEQVVHQVVDLAHPRRVIVFGSAAKGRVGPEGDLDFLVVVSDNEHVDTLTDRLNTQIRHKPMPCDFMVVEEGVLERNLDNPGLIYGEIMTNGREVYAC